MGLFNLATSLLGGNSNNILSTVMQVINSQPGGLGGIVDSLQRGGLGDAVGSWISTGQNQPVSGDQLQNALPGGILQEIAARLGTSPDGAGSQLSELLPRIVDQLTPDGQVPGNGLSGAGTDLLGSILGQLGNR